MFRRHLAVAFLVLLGSALASAPCSGQVRVVAPQFRVLPVLPGPTWFHQFYHRQPFPFYPSYFPSAPFMPYGYPGMGYGSETFPDPYGGYLKGAADVINSQGQYLKSTQEAYLLAEQVKTKQLENRRKAYEDYLWERSITPTLNEQREREQREEVRRSLIDPPATEVWIAKSLNDLLVHLQDLRARGIEGAAVGIQADILRSINVAPAKGPAAIGLIKQINRLNWPDTLRTLPPVNETRAIQFQIDGLLADGRRQALAHGRVDPGVIRELERNVEALRGLLKNQVADTPFSAYVEARRYLQHLDDAVKVLQQPDVADYLNGKYTAQGETVKDLVAYLTDNGLRFTPAGPGEEASYAALHRALAQYQQSMAAKQPGK